MVAGLSGVQYIFLIYGRPSPPKIQEIEMNRVNRNGLVMVCKTK